MSGEEPIMGVFEESFLTTQWTREPDFWEEAFVVEDGQRFVFHLVAQRNESLVWCGYLGYPGAWPHSDEDFRVVETAAHAGETTGVLITARRPKWPGYVYPGFDCGHVDDWSPKDGDRHGSRTKVTAASYRPLEYVQSCLREMARVFVRQLDPLTKMTIAEALEQADRDEDADIAHGPEPML